MSNYPIFSVLGIEIEYMLVDIETLNVQAKSDRILQALAGTLVNEVVLGDIAVSNELVMHVLELKTHGPKAPTVPIANQFQAALEKIEVFLREQHLQFLPGGAHPWMDPLVESTRWPHGNHEIYHQYDAIFDCRGHGWSNLQCMHVNLPFSNKEEFRQLHNAIRLILPLIPALAASTPFLDGRPTGMQSSRLDFYGKNQQRIPSISGDIIPDFINTEHEYQEKILSPMFEDISPHDPKGILQYEWLNSRAAIPKFAVNAIEIRIIDSQEYIDADIAIAQVILAILKKWHHHSHYFLDNPCDTASLKALYDQTRIHGLSVPVVSTELKQQWQLKPGIDYSCRDVWSILIEQVAGSLDKACQKALEIILSQGNLSERLIKACNQDFSHANLMQVYRQLGDCLMTNRALT